MTINLSMNLDKNLKKLMKQRKLSIVDISKSIGIPKSTIHGWLNGVHPRSVIELNRLAIFFETNIHQICFALDHPIEEKNDKNEKIIAVIKDVALILKVIK